MNPVAQLKAFAELTVSDLFRSKKFYVEQLGFKVESEESNLVRLEFGPDFQLSLIGNREESKGQQGVLVGVGDVNSEYQRLKDAGVQFNNVFGSTQIEAFTLEDPDGNVLSYCGMRTY